METNKSLSSIEGPHLSRKCQKINSGKGALNIYSELFHPDNVKNLVEGGKISVSNHKLMNELKGTSGLAKSLNSDIKVSLTSGLISVERNPR